MNLRLDSESIRLRLELEEAVRLRGGTSLGQPLAFVGRDLFVRLERAEELSCSWNMEAFELRVQVPALELGALVDSISAGKVDRKAGIRGEILGPSGRIGVKVEIDALSARKSITDVPRP